MARRIPPRAPRRAAFGALAVLAAFAPLACSSDDEPAARASAGDAFSATSSGACRQVPVAGASLPWLPADLPLPDGSFPIQDVDAAAPPPSVASDTHRGLIAVRGTVDDFVAFVNTQWTAKGWSLGKGDAERGEAEGGYRRGDVGGVYRVRNVYCDANVSELLIVFGPGAGTDAGSESG